MRRRNPSIARASRITHRPPDTQLPTHMAAISADMARVNRLHSEAQSQLQQLDNEWTVLLEAAHKADAAASQDAVLAGTGDPVATPNHDALIERRRLAKAHLDAYAAT